MRNTTKGSFRVLTTRTIYNFPSGGPADPNARTAELRVVNDAFWIRLCMMGDLGFAEAYMYGDVECDDLVSLFNIFLDNRENLTKLESKVSYLYTLPQKITSYRFLNTIGNSRSNISAHYDISNDMFAAFLSKDMTYSCAIFEDLDGDLEREKDRVKYNGGRRLIRLNSDVPCPGNPDGDEAFQSAEEEEELYEGQMRKLHHIMQKARILPGHRILEIGSGWGSMAMLIAKTVPDTTIDTLTLSVEQQVLAQQRIKAAGMQDRITVHLMDYRNMPTEWKGAFDRLISIEMIEAVGQEFIPTYWKQVDWALKSQNAIGVVQVITIPEARFERYIEEIDFIQKWVLFPGGFLPTLTFLIETLQAGTKGKLTVDSVSNIGPHYARTLREWRRRFLRVFDAKIVPALQRQYPDVMSGPNGKREIEVFKRKWLCACYCEVGFSTRTLGDHIITFAREGATEYGCEVYH
ncbi:CFS1-like protein [Cylindrobasidium torrendii FP15055 ss-10]|uniref:CFS1-like protein n=1 Tax=Cylindrobasidium torrendii FP15055 ss-10 TaxID=1314674 RepID=A0A0D7BKX8_9AGAR|nr:CFS1-like protein [Cylindrobasidium torrendii FP15055 ss-10]